MYDPKDIFYNFEKLRRRNTKIDAIGIILHAREYRLVGWKEEEIIEISDGSDFLLSISFWKNHSRPKSCNLLNMQKEDFKGNIMIIRNITITDYVTDEDKTIVFGEIKDEDQRICIMPIINRSAIIKFVQEDEPFEINQSHSILPFNHSEFFPHSDSEYIICKRMLRHYSRYKYLSEVSSRCRISLGTYFLRSIVRRSEILSDNSTVTQTIEKFADLKI